MNEKTDLHVRKQIRLRDFDYFSCETYFITVCTKNRQCLFGTPTIPTVINQLKGYVSKQVGFPVWQKLYFGPRDKKPK